MKKQLPLFLAIICCLLSASFSFAAEVSPSSPCAGEFYVDDGIRDGDYQGFWVLFGRLGEQAMMVRQGGWDNCDQCIPQQRREEIKVDALCKKDSKGANILSVSLPLTLWVPASNRFEGMYAKRTFSCDLSAELALCTPHDQELTPTQPNIWFRVKFSKPYGY